MLEFLSSVWIGIKPFLVGALIAYLLAVPCNKLYAIFSKKLNAKFANFLSVITVEVGVFVFIALFMLLVAPQCVTSINSIVSNIPNYLDACQLQIDMLVSNYKILADAGLKDFNIYSNLSKLLIDNISVDTTQILNTVYERVYGLGTSLVNIFLSFIASVFILLDRTCAYERLKKIIIAIFPTKHLSILRGFEKANVTFRQFVVGKSVDSLIIGVICFIVFLIFDIPFALTISVFICITNMIPIVGPIIGAIPGIFIIFSESPVKAFQFAILILIIQQIDGNIIGPKCIGHSIGLNTFWVLFSVLLFGKLFGAVGMFFGVPIFTIIYDWFNNWVDNHQTIESHTFLKKIKRMFKLNSD